MAFTPIRYTRGDASLLQEKRWIALYRGMRWDGLFGYAARPLRYAYSGACHRSVSHGCASAVARIFTDISCKFLMKIYVSPLSTVRFRYLFNSEFLSIEEHVATLSLDGVRNPLQRRFNIVSVKTMKTYFSSKLAA